MSGSAGKEIGSLPDGHQRAAGWRNKELQAAECQTASTNWLAVDFELTQRQRHLLEKGGARFSKAPTALYLGALTHLFDGSCEGFQIQSSNLQQVIYFIVKDQTVAAEHPSEGCSENTAVLYHIAVCLCNAHIYLARAGKH